MIVKYQVDRMTRTITRCEFTRETTQRLYYERQNWHGVDESWVQKNGGPCSYFDSWNEAYLAMIEIFRERVRGAEKNLEYAEQDLLKALAMEHPEGEINA